MADRVPADQAALETELRDLGRRLVVPPAADPTAAVLARLAVGAGGLPARGRELGPWWLRVAARRRRNRRLAAAAVLTLLAGLGFTPVGQAAVARVVHVAGVVLRLGAVDAPRRPEQLPGQVDSSLAAARRQVAFPIAVPAGLGPPDQVQVFDAGRVVSLVYRAGPGRPSPGPGGVAARLDQFDGSLDVLFIKEVGAGAPTEYLELAGAETAIWIAAPHDVTYVDRQGTPRTESAHLAEWTLIWQSGGVTFRLEGGFTKEQAVAVAADVLAGPGLPSLTANTGGSGNK